MSTSSHPDWRNLLAGAAPSDRLGEATLATGAADIAVKKTSARPKTFIVKWLMFAAGLGSAVYFKLGGTFGYSEVFIFGVSVFLILYIKQFIRPYLYLALAAVAWVAGIFIADLLNQADIGDTVKLVGSVLLLTVNVYGLLQMMRISPESAIYFVTGNGISNLLQFYFLPPPLMAAEYASNFNDNLDVRLTWIAITHFLPCISLAALLWFKNMKKTALSLVLLAGFGTLYLGSRAYFLVAVISIFLLFSAIKDKKLADSGRKNGLMFAAIALGLLVAGFSYRFLAVSGALGEYAQDKYAWQSETEGVGILSGRIDFIEGLYAIYLNPIVGYGSYASENNGISQDLYRILGITSIEPRESMPNHSHILGAWVYSGLLSLPLWMYIVALVLKALGRVIDSSYAGFFVPFALVVLWNIFF
jgi:hypothetical protein